MPYRYLCLKVPYITCPPHVGIAPNTDLFVNFFHVVDTYGFLQNILQLPTNDVQKLTISTLHVIDSLQKPI